MQSFPTHLPVLRSSQKQRAATAPHAKGLALSAVLLVSLSGCSELKRSHVRTDEEVLSRTPIVVPANRFDAEMKQKGEQVEVVVTPVCRLIEEEEVERTEVHERELDDDDPLWMTVLGVAGTAPLAGGIVMLVDAPNVFENNLNQRTYNASGQGSAIAGGVLLTAIGAAMVLPPVVQAFRAVGTSEEERIEKRHGKVIREDVACTVRAPQSYQVQIRAPHQTLTVASGSGRGKHRIDLKSALPLTFFRNAPSVSSAGLYVNNDFVGTVDLSRVAGEALSEELKRDLAAWTAAEPSACQTQHTAQACAGVSAYTQNFPNGKHIAEARALLAVPQKPAGGAVVATGPQTDQARLIAAIEHAVDARAKVEEKVFQKADQETERIVKAADKDAEKQGKRACEQACDAKCEKDASCKTSCKAEACK